MSDHVERRVNEWVRNNIHTVGLARPASDHLTVILEENIGKKQMIDLSIIAFQAITKEVIRHYNSVQAMLFIRLISSSKILRAATPRSLSEIKREWRSVEPPELFLLHWKSKQLLNRFEEYRCPLRFDMWTNIDPGIYAYYSEARSMTDLANDWEYGRSIQVYYYPEEYRI